MIQGFSITVPKQHVISSNRKSEIYKRQNLKRYCADTVPYLARGLKPVGSATILVGVTKPTANRYDPVNLTDTVKPVVDVLVSRGVLDDDDHRHVLGPWLLHSGVDRGLRDAVRFEVVLFPLLTAAEVAQLFSTKGE